MPNSKSAIRNSLLSFRHVIFCDFSPLSVDSKIKGVNRNEQHPHRSHTENKSVDGSAWIGSVIRPRQAAENRPHSSVWVFPDLPRRHAVDGASGAGGEL